MGAGKASGGFDRCLVWELWELGPSPPVSNTLLSKVKRNGNQIMVRTSGGKQQTQHSVKFKTLVTVWECCTRKFSLLRKTLGAVLKD